ncbi:hypothetical protein ACLB2K_068784 [Fragaria x ananassa]
MQIIARGFACVGAVTESEITRIRFQLSHLISSLTNHGIVSQTRRDNESVTPERSTTSLPTVPTVVGLEEDVGILVRHLVGGMGGIGKTTVAKQVYCHQEIRDHFDCIAWVCLSQEFQPRDVLQEILTQLTSATDEERRKFAEMNASKIAELLDNTQQGKKCGEGGFLYEARPLTELESWMLFKQIAFLEPVAHTESIQRKVELGMKMVERCGGLPLAVIVLAGLLARRNTVEEWLTVSKDVEAYLTGGRDIHRRILRMLKISYDNLPERLQICFQYLGNFPEDYEIPVKTLTRLWIAEGLIAPISSESAENIEDASYGYLNELAERCMVEVVKHSLTGNIKTIRLHDLMLELCREMVERENFLYVVNSSKATETKASIKKVQRLAVHFDGIGHELAPPCDKRHASLRSLLFFVRGHYYSDIHRKLLRSLCRDFKFLKVLKFEDMKAEPEIELPSDIGNLVHLRFLSLKNSEIKRLPSSVANLVCLQTLDLRSVEWVSVKIPNVFWKMAKLRHLYLPLNHRVTEKLSLATLHNLQTLANISSQDCDLKDLIELTDLRKLVLDAREPTESKALEEIMKSHSITFDHLQSLSLVTGNGNGDIPTLILLRCPHLLKLQLYGRIKGFPDDDRFSNLIKVTLEETNLQACHIKRLEKLTKLKVLSLRMGALKLETMVFSKEGFPQLKFLSLLGLCELKEWRVEEGAMPRLYSLHIGYCWRLRAVPDGLQHILTLKELTIKRMYHDFCKRLEKGGADFDKFRHASVTITNKRMKR